MHVFVDESKARGYLLVAVTIRSKDVARLRKTLRSFLLGGQTRLHFTKEHVSRRRQVLAALTDFELTVTVVKCSLPNELSARGACLRALVTEVEWPSATHIVIERDHSMTQRDNRLLQSILARHETRAASYEIIDARFDPGLWAADAIAWALQRGGEWTARIAMHPTTIINR